VCNGCCLYTTAVGTAFALDLQAARLNGSQATVSIFAAEEPGIPIGSTLQSAVANSSLALSTFRFTPLRLHSNLTIAFHIHASHDASLQPLCLAVTISPPAPVYTADSLNASTNRTVAVNCLASVTVAVEDSSYACSVRISRMQTVSPTGVVTPALPKHTLQALTATNRSSLTLSFVPAFGSEFSTFTACFVGGDVIGMRQLPEVCVNWTVNKCEYVFPAWFSLWLFLWRACSDTAAAAAKRYSACNITILQFAFQCQKRDTLIRYIAQLYSGDYNWRRLFNMNPSLGDPDLIFTNNKRLVVGSLYVFTSLLAPLTPRCLPPTSRHSACFAGTV
jgi:hypothetical protein